jgi:uncharacterized protein
MKRKIIFVLIGILSCVTALARNYTVNNVPNVHVANRTQYVSNPDGILSDNAVNQLNVIIDSIWSKTTAEVVAVVIDDIDEDSDINTFATDLYEAWGIGKKDNDNGVLVLIVKDQRKGVIRTGYGAEGVLPDAICMTLLNRYIYPYFKEGDYDSGMINGVSQLATIFTDPEAAEELKSKYANNAADDDEDLMDIFYCYLYFSIFITVILLIVMIFLLNKTKNLDRAERYRKMVNFKNVAFGSAFVALAIPFLVYLPLRLLMKSWREKPRVCPNCGAKMKKLDEVHDNDYLTPGQDLEERLNTVDYDVWLCPKCGETDIYPFVNQLSGYEVCEQCGMHTSKYQCNRIVVKPTTTQPGAGVKEYVCKNCLHITRKRYSIPREEVPVIFPIGGGGGGRGFGGGGFSGGSFGGGHTGGGGASGGW